MIITIPWLKEHLKTTAKEGEIINQLTNIGLEVEAVKENSGDMNKFKIAKVLKAEKHPNADKLKVCDVTIGGSEILKVVCGAPNAREGLITIYAPPGAIIPSPSLEIFNSLSEQSIPLDSTPLIFATFNRNFVLGIIVPGGA